MPDAGGYPVVLTADRTLMADYRLLFDGMLVASQTSTTPQLLVNTLLMPRPRGRNGRASVAPLGLRRIEAALLEGGFTPEQVALVDDEQLPRAVGPNTRVVAIASGEPAGRGMNTTTMTAVAGGAIYPQVMFGRLLRRARELAPQAKIVVGGPGSWQLAGDEDARRAAGIDHLVTGYAEGNAAALFRSLLDGESLPDVVPGEPVPAEAVPRIRGASTMGVVEISRGCGLGCSFCTISRVPMMHVPEETILADAETNVAAGVTSIAVLSEDFFRYGGQGLSVDPGRLLALLSRLREIRGLRLIQLDHANVISIAQYSDIELAEAHRLLVGKNRHRYLWVNVGVETASGELLKANGGGAKIGRHRVEDWGELCADQVRRLCRAGFFPMVSLMVGLRGERERHIRETLEWVRSIRHERLSVFPVLYAPIDGSAGLQTRDLTPAHWELFRLCYGLNFKWIPRMYWDNQTGAGVSLAKRLAIQALGKGQVVEWNLLFAWHSRRSRA